MPRSTFSIPSTRARAESLSMIQALDAFRRSTSQTRPAIAARSPEPAKRCAVPHSFNACAAGTRWASMMSMTSIAADSRAAGVISSFRFRGDHNRLDKQKNLQREVDPHRKQYKHAGEPCERARPDVVGGHENAGMGKPRHHER